MAKKVLIIDDDPDIVEVTKLTLEQHGYEVVTAADGDEGLQRVKEDPPDLILLDVMMRTADEGFSVCYKLKSDERWKNIPVVMLTAITERTGFRFSPATDGEWLEPDEYLEKPVQPKELLKVVGRLLGD